MKNLKLTTWLCLMMLLTCSTRAASISREFSLSNISEASPRLEINAPSDKYVMLDLGKGWLLLNSFFYDNIHLKLAWCDEHMKTVESIKDKLINNPETISWWQEKPIVLYGFPIIFSAGLALGVFITK